MRDSFFVHCLAAGAQAEARDDVSGWWRCNECNSLIDKEGRIKVAGFYPGVMMFDIFDGHKVV